MLSLVVHVLKYRKWSRHTDFNFNSNRQLPKAEGGRRLWTDENRWHNKVQRALCNSMSKWGLQYSPFKGPRDYGWKSHHICLTTSMQSGPWPCKFIFYVHIYIHIYVFITVKKIIYYVTVLKWFQYSQTVQGPMVSCITCQQVFTFTDVKGHRETCNGYVCVCEWEHVFIVVFCRPISGLYTVIKLNYEVVRLV